jgi:hypothetical protein
VTESGEDACWNCGVIPKRWFDMSHPGVDEERLVCSNCFAATTRPRISYGWRSPTPDWDDDEDEKSVSPSERLADRVSPPDRRPHLIPSLFAAIERLKRRRRITRTG